jgi:hypothetical protein
VKPKKKWFGKCFVLYDGRAKSGDTDNATALITAHSEREARRDSREWSGYDAIWYEYDIVNGEATNEKARWDIKVPA